MYLKLLDKMVHGDYMGLIRTWWHDCSWYLAYTRIFMFYNKIVKTIRHEANMGELMVKIENVYLEYSYPCTRYGGIYSTWIMSLYDMSY